MNPDDLEGHPGIIANPNCSTMQLVPVLMALRDAVGLERVVVDTYQAVSGTGGEAIRELEGQVRAHVAGEPQGRLGLPPPDRVQRPARRSTSSSTTATRRRSGRSSRESRKILHLPDLRVSCTAVRIPVFVAHSEAVHVETRAPITPDRARELFAAVPGVVVQDDPSTSTYPLATAAAGTRRDLRRARPPGPVDRRATAASRSGSCRDNLRKGAATNAVQIAEVLVERGWVRPPRPAARRRTSAEGTAIGAPA